MNWAPQPVKKILQEIYLHHESLCRRGVRLHTHTLANMQTCLGMRFIAQPKQFKNDILKAEIHYPI